MLKEKYPEYLLINKIKNIYVLLSGIYTILNFENN